MLTKLYLSDIAEIVNGQLVGGDAQVLSVTQDTRSLSEHALYVAIKGERFDGHEFIYQAQQQNASGALVSKVDESLPAFGQVLVADTLNALSMLAAWHRQKFTGSVVAITGSAGKTTCKELMANILKQRANTWMTQGNLNNHIGVPLTLMRLEPEHKSAVIELGASSEGEISATASIVKPQVGILTNASEAHLQGFKDLHTIVRTKGELISHIADDGFAVLNKTDAHYAIWQKQVAANPKLKSLSFGLDNSADVYAQDIQKTQQGYSFELHYLDKHSCINVPLLGVHNVLNALAVSAAALALGLSMQQITQGLNQGINVKGRLNWVAGINQSRILDDSYNASPASVYAAIDVLSEYEHSVLVLGELGELGEESKHIHFELGKYAKNKGIQRLFCYGEQARFCVEAFGDEAQYFAVKDDLIDDLTASIAAHSVVLVKGSRSSAMEQVTQALENKNTIGDNECFYG